MRIIFSTSLMLLFIFIGFGFVFRSGTDYQVVPLNKVSIEQKISPAATKTGTFLYTESKQLKSAFPGMAATDMVKFDFENNRYVHIQYAEQNGCKEEVEVIQEMRKYKHYYEIILIPYNNSNCKTKVKPYQITSIPNDGLPVLMTGTLPE
jgi:hypothetical protein